MVSARRKRSEISGSCSSISSRSEVHIGDAIRLADDARSSHRLPAFADVILRVDFKIVIEHYDHSAKSGAEFNLPIALVEKHGPIIVPFFLPAEEGAPMMEVPRGVTDDRARSWAFGSFKKTNFDPTRLGCLPVAQSKCSNYPGSDCCTWLAELSVKPGPHSQAMPPAS